ncbi:hypothetical protein [Pseudomonas sp.]|uniref:hypothetical protein n=1 Tax=Pseudomonas sp. TaxID=306 RepID=UPI003FD83EAC
MAAHYVFLGQKVLEYTFARFLSGTARLYFCLAAPGAFSYLAASAGEDMLVVGIHAMRDASRWLETARI